jgi:hypothetical protein
MNTNQGQNHNTNLVIQYAKSTQTVCLCLSILAFLIIIFILSPLNIFFISSLFGKAIIIILLGFTMYYNIQQTNLFASNFNISFFENDWNTIKTNVLCSYVFTILLVFLTVSVLRA